MFSLGRAHDLAHQYSFSSSDSLFFKLASAESTPALYTALPIYKQSQLRRPFLALMFSNLNNDLAPRFSLSQRLQRLRHRIQALEFLIRKCNAL